MSKTHSTIYQRGFSLIEILIVVAILGIIVGIAVPNVIAARRAANEASAVQSLRTINSSQNTYKSTFGGGQDYALTLTVLSTNGLIDGAIGGGVKSGYQFSVTGSASTGSAASTYSATAIPFGLPVFTGTRTFYVDETGVIRYEIAPTSPTSSSTPFN